MKKEAVKTRPMARVKTESVGYHESGTGLVIGFGAFNINQKHRIRKLKLRRQQQNEIELPSQNVETTAPDLARSKFQLQFADYKPLFHSLTLVYTLFQRQHRLWDHSPCATLVTSPTSKAQYLFTLGFKFL